MDGKPLFYAFYYLLMKITPLEFVKKEFPKWDGKHLPPDVWLRKMQEFAILTNEKIDLGRLLELDYPEKNALRSAAGALYFDDNSDYKNALYQVIHHLTKIPFSDLSSDTVRSIYYLFEPA